MIENKFKNFTPDQYDEHFQDFLIESWSFSKVSTFARNEKMFEKDYVWNERSKMGPSAYAGTAYHKALEVFFKQYRTGTQLDAADLEIEAFSEIEDIPAKMCKLGKTTPDMESFKQTVTKHTVALIANFIKEVGIYLDDVDEILDVEVYCNEWLVVNGVDNIPLPCHAVIDLVLRLKPTEDYPTGKIVIVDHKSVSAYSEEIDIAFTRGQQAITYVLSYESRTGLVVNEVWFIENKYSKNKDGGSQLVRFPVVADKDTRVLYEAMLYEPLRRMVTAVHDPDYVFLINHSDNMQDPAEMLDFWLRSVMSEVSEFDVSPKKRDLIEKRQRKIRDAGVEMISPQVIKKFKAQAATFIQYDLSKKDMSNSEKIEHVLTRFNKPVKVEYVIEGYSSNSYLLAASAGVSLSSIVSHKLDLAHALNVDKVRISESLIVYNGKSYLCVEANKIREKVLLYDPAEVEEKKVPIGRDNFGNKIVWNLDNPSTPHAVVCGATGSGKTVLVKTAIASVKPMGYKVIIMDPKHTKELKAMKGERGVEIWNEIEYIEERMKDLVKEMNEAIADDRQLNIFLVIDELADAINQMKTGKALDFIGYDGVKDRHKTLEQNLQMLLQKGRSANLRVLVGLQRASTKILNGDLKVNLTVQICLRVQKEIDSRVVLDEAGAEALAGNGDGLIKSPEYNDTVRFQGYFIDDKK